MVLLGEQRQKAAAGLSQAWDAGILHLVLENNDRKQQHVCLRLESES